MKNNELIGYGLLAVLAAVILQHTWQWVIGGLAVFGALYLFDQINRNRRN